MIFRKPYAFLIKHFRLFHILLALIMVYLIDRTNNLLKFISQYLSNNSIIYYKEYASKLFNNWMFILPVIMIIILLIILILLFRKKKPTIFYIINIINAVGLIVIYNITLSTVIRMETEILANQSVSLIRDFLLILLISQIYSFAITFIRAVGFDIKKFDFGKDLQELDVSDEDSEEIEISINVDSNKINRKFRKTRRFAKYNYLENKLLYNTIIIFVGIIIIGSTVYLSLKKGDYIKMYEPFLTDDFVMTIKNAYVTSQDYKGNIISNDKCYVIVEVDISSIDGLEKYLSNSNTQLLFKSQAIYHNSNKKSLFFDLGNIYNGEKITSKTDSKLFLFEIPKINKNSTFIFRYADKYETNLGRLNPKFIDVELGLIDLDNIKNKNVQLNEEIIVDSTIYNNTKISIEKLEMKDKFTINYQKKISDNEYYYSIEYIKAKVNENYDKSILNIKGNINISNLSSIIKKPYTFLENFSKIIYKIDNEEKVYKFSNNEVLSDKTTIENDYYLEIPSEILNSSEAYLQIKLRNKMYQYKIK